MSFLLIFGAKIFNYVVIWNICFDHNIVICYSKPQKPGFIFEKTRVINVLRYSLCFSALLNQEVAHTVIGKTGKYYVLVQKGEYYAKLKKIGENEYRKISILQMFLNQKRLYQ